MKKDMILLLYEASKCAIALALHAIFLSFN